MKTNKLMWLSIVCAFVLLLAACGGNQQEAKENGGGSGDKAQTSASSGQSKANNTATDKEKPAASRDLTVMMTYHASMEQFQNGEDMNDNKLVKLLREQSGFNVKYESLPKDNPAQKTSIILASGDVPDLIRIGGKADYFRLAQQGAFEPLDEWIKEHIPNLSTMLPDEVMDSTRYEGKIYGIPHRSAQQVGSGILVRDDILKELQLDDPVTLDDFYQTMITIRDQKGIAPLTATAANPGAFMGAFQPFAAAFGVGGTTTVNDGELAFTWLQPEYKAFLETMKTWYDEGLIDQEFSINKDIQDKMITGSSAFTVTFWGTSQFIDRAITERGEGGEIRYIAPVVGDAGQGGFGEEAMAGGSYWVIPKQAKNKEAAAAYINFILSPDTDFFLTYGIEGEDYTKEGDKVIQTAEQSNAIPWRTLYFMGDSDPSFFARLDAKGFLPYYEPLIPFQRKREETTYAPSVEAYDAKFSELRNFAEENALKFIMNKRNLDEFDKFVQEFNARGGQAAIDAMNEWYTNK